MATYTVTIDDSLAATVTRLATANSTTEAYYLSSVVGSHVLSQYKLDLVNFFQNSPLPDIARVEAVKVDIAAERAVAEAEAAAAAALEEPIV